LPTLKISQSEAELEAKFSPRLWTLVHDTPRLYEALLLEFVPFQLAAADLRPEGSGTVGGAALSFWLVGFRIVVTLRLDGFVVRCTALKEVTGGQLTQALSAAEAAVRRAVGDHYVREGVTVTYACHGVVDGATTQEVLEPFVGASPAVEGLGETVGAGAAFYYANSQSLLGASVTLDVSRVVAGGLFVRANFIVRPELFGDGFVDLMVTQVAHVFGALNLEEAEPWT
jgi:hypothetical protein